MTLPAGLLEGLVPKVAKGLLELTPEEVARLLPTEQGQNLLRFMEGSKVRRPVFHGTQNDFTQFKKTYDIGFHVGTPGAANDRLASLGLGLKVPWRHQKVTGGVNVMPLWLSARNPIEVPDFIIPTPATLMEALLDKKILNDEEVTNIFRHYRGDSDRYAAIRANLYNKGYDSLKYINEVEDAGSTSYVAFSPGQLKSVFGNKGTYDPLNPDIMYGAAPIPLAAAGMKPKAAPQTPAGGDSWFKDFLLKEIGPQQEPADVTAVHLGPLPKGIPATSALRHFLGGGLTGVGGLMSGMPGPVAPLLQYGLQGLANKVSGGAPSNLDEETFHQIGEWGLPLLLPPWGIPK